MVCQCFQWSVWLSSDSQSISLGLLSLSIGLQAKCQNKWFLTDAVKIHNIHTQWTVSTITGYKMLYIIHSINTEFKLYRAHILITLQKDSENDYMLRIKSFVVSHTYTGTVSMLNVQFNREEKIIIIIIIKWLEFQQKQ